MPDLDPENDRDTRPEWDELEFHETDPRPDPDPSLPDDVDPAMVVLRRVFDGDRMVVRKATHTSRGDYQVQLRGCALKEQHRDTLTALGFRVADVAPGIANVDGRATAELGVFVNDYRGEPDGR